MDAIPAVQVASQATNGSSDGSERGVRHRSHRIFKTERESLGVDFISYQENIDTTTPQGEMIFTVLASLAQFESALISDRVKAGMARARAQGKRISRAPIPRGVQGRIADLYRQEVSMHQISKQLGIGYGTAWNYVQRIKAGHLHSDMSNLFP